MATQIFRSILKMKPTNILMKRWESSEKKVSIYDPFLIAKKKDKMTYLEAIKLFETREKRRRGHVEFIYAALARMQDFGVHKDLEAYKALVDVLPKGKFVATNIFQSEFMHYPKQQQCAVDLLEQMEDNSKIQRLMTTL